MTEIVTTAGYANVAGIYCILNIVSGKVYIGSASSLKARLCCHRSMLRRGRHDNGHLQRAWSLHGEQNFQFFLVQACAVSDLTRFEARWMQMTAACCPDYGYNLDRVATHTMHAEETKQKIASSLRGQRRSVEQRRNIAKGMTGVKHAPRTAEQRLRYSRALMGHAVSEATRKKMSAVHKGKVITEAHRQSIRDFWRKRRENLCHESFK